MTVQSLPKVCVIDLDAGVGGRDWVATLGEHTRIEWNGWPPPGVMSPLPEAGSILVCHLLDTAARAAITKAARSGSLVVVVSAGGQINGHDSENIYERRRPVSKPVDAEFGACLFAFRKALRASGQPAWDLLEGGGVVPHHLITHYLLQLVGLAATSDRLRIRPQAERQFVELTGNLPDEIDALRQVAINHLINMGPLACISSKYRNKIKHSFVDNIFLGLRSNELLKFCDQESAELKRYRGLVNAFLVSLPHGYDPRPLLNDLWPLHSTDSAVFTEVSDELGRRFTAEFLEKADVRRLSSAFESVDNRLSEFVGSSRLSADRLTTTAYETFRAAASDLALSLDSFPKGIWLP